MAEEETEAKTDGADDAEGDQGKKSKKLLIVIAAAVVLLLGGGGAAFFLLSKDSDEKTHTATPTNPEDHSNSGQKTEGEEHAAEAGEPSGEHGKAKDGEVSSEGGKEKDGEDTSKTKGQENIKFGQTISLKSFHLNLGNPLENRYLRLEIAIEYMQGDEQKSEIEARLPQLRDAIISVASRKTREFLLGPDGKDQLRLEMLNRINQYMDRKVEAIYITDMLIE